MRKADIPVDVELGDVLLLFIRKPIIPHIIVNLQKFNKALKELSMLVSDGTEFQSFITLTVKLYFFTIILTWGFNNFSPLNLV